MTKSYLVTTWGFDSGADVQKALEELVVNYEIINKKPEPLRFKVSLTGEQIVLLSDKFDVMIRHITGDERLVYLDTKGGRFKQR